MSSNMPTSEIHSASPPEVGATRTDPQDQTEIPQRRRRHFGPRTCRICLEVVQPTFPEAKEGSLGWLLTRNTRPTFVSEDPEFGRLISPCKCRGSIRFVHEGCLEEWRRTDSLTKDNNFVRCPTCHFKYRLERLSLARRLKGHLAQITLTIGIFFCCIFVLGFFADPILSAWVDPVGILADAATSVLDNVEPSVHEPEVVEPGTWLEHFLKGFFSLGLLGFLNVLFALNPWQWWNLRSSGLLGRSGRRGGNARVQDISWALVVIGALTFMYRVWKFVRKLSASALEKISDRVLDVGGDDDGDDDSDVDDNSKKDL